MPLTSQFVTFEQLCSLFLVMQLGNVMVVVLYATFTASLVVIVRTLILRVQSVGRSSTNSHSNQILLCVAFGQQGLFFLLFGKEEGQLFLVT